MKRILILRGTVCAGRTVAPGEIVDAPERDADFLVAIGKAAIAAQDAPAAEAVDDYGQAAQNAPRPRGRPRKVAA